MSKYANDLSVIHTTPKRLNQAGEIRFVARSAGSHAYEWQKPITPVVMTDKSYLDHLRGEKPSGRKVRK